MREGKPEVISQPVAQQPNFRNFVSIRRPS
jgi:hypothetical protein